MPNEHEQDDQFRRRDWYAERQHQYRAATTVLYHGNPTDDDRIKIILDMAWRYSSVERLRAMLPFLIGLPDSCFWRGFEKVWPVCDDTWEHRACLLWLLRRHQDNAPARQSGDQTELLRVYRGCSADRVRGVSWSLSRDVAEGFARGHRGISIPDPVVATALIPRGGAFVVDYDDRKEREVVLDPRRLRRIEVEPFVGMTAFEIMWQSANAPA